MLDLLRTDAPAWFSVEEVALAADVPTEGVWRLIEKGQAAVHEPKRLMSAADAVHLVRVLEGTEPESPNRFPFNKIPRPPRKTARSLMTSGAAHALGVLLLIVSASIGLADSSGVPAWIVKKNKNELVTWAVPPNVTIDSIKSKTAADTLPLDPAGSQGGSAGTSFNSKVKNSNKPSTDYRYNIFATCNPGGGKPVLRLKIDPEMIIP